MRVIFLIIISFFSVELLAQDVSDPGDSPKAMVIPFAKENEDMRTVMEKDSLRHLRVAMTKVSAAFDSTDLTTIDFQAFLRQMSNDRVITHNHLNFPKNIVLHYAQIDFYIEVEAQIIETPRGNSATVILNSYDAFSGRSLANGVGHSPKFYTQNFEKLTEKALDTFLEDFVEMTISGFERLEKNGRPLSLKIGFNYDVDLDMDSYVGDSEASISEWIEQWLEENTLDAAFKIQGITSNQMIVNSIRIPEANEKKYSANYPMVFARKFRLFLASKKIYSTFDLQGTNIFITIL